MQMDSPIVLDAMPLPLVLSQILAPFRPIWARFVIRAVYIVPDLKKMNSPKPLNPLFKNWQQAPNLQDVTRSSRNLVEEVWEGFTRLMIRRSMKT